MSPRGRKAPARKSKSTKRASEFEVGQKVVVDGYGAGTVIAVEARRGGRYSDIWVRPDENPAQEIGLPYQHKLIEPV
jgi:hypothetical protein